MKVVIVLPTYNESENIVELINQIMFLDDYNIVIVDDSSPDGTGLLADNLVQLYKDRIYVIHRTVRGRASAGLEGFKYALKEGAEYIVEMDSDFSHPVSLIPTLVDLCQSYDVAIASKYALGGGSNEDSRLRVLISRGANLYASALLGRGIHIKDWCGGFKCYRASALSKLALDSFFSHGYSIGAETLYRLKLKGSTFTETPYTFIKRTRGKSKFSIRQILSYIYVITKLRLLSI